MTTLRALDSNKTRYRCFKVLSTKVLHLFLAVTDLFTQGLVTLPRRTQSLTSTRPKTANQIHRLH